MYVCMYVTQAYMHASSSLPCGNIGRTDLKSWKCVTLPKPETQAWRFQDPALLNECLLYPLDKTGMISMYTFGEPEPGAGFMKVDDRLVTTVQPSFHHRHSTNRASWRLPSSAKDELRYDCKFTDDGNASWYSVCRVPMVDWRFDCRHSPPRWPSG